MRNRRSHLQIGIIFNLIVTMIMNTGRKTTTMKNRRNHFKKKRIFYLIMNVKTITLTKNRISL